MLASETVIFIESADGASGGPSFTACLMCARAARPRMLPCGGAEIVTVRLDSEIIEVHCGATIGDEHPNEGATGY